MYKVSIIIPTYSRANFIERAINSALQQVNIQYEIIVVDDNGLGTQGQIEVQKKLNDFIVNNQIIYIPHQVNMNGSAARNTGMRKATGDFIAFLDDDDWFEVDKLIEQITLMEKEKTDACLCGFTRVYKDECTPISVPHFDEGYERELLAFKIDTCAGSCLTIRRALIEKIGFFDTSFIRHQDLEYLYRISKKTQISVVERGLSKIYMHCENTKPKLAKKVEEYRLHFIKKFEKDIVKLQKKDTTYVLNRHYQEIAKAYLKNNNILGVIYWIFKTSNPIRTLFFIFIDAVKFIKSRRKANRTL